MDAILPCFALVPALHSRSGTNNLRHNADRFVSGASYVGMGLRKAKQSSIVKASVRGNDQSEQYKKFAEFLGAPEGKFAEKEQVEDTVEPVEVDQAAIAAKLADDYEKMVDVLGPPKGRFQGKNENVGIRASKRAPKAEPMDKTRESSNDTRANEPREQKLPELKKEAKTKEEEYALFESILRKSGGKGNKPRKGGRRYATWETTIEGFVMDPWNTDFNLMPTKDAAKTKGSPPRKGQAPFKIPDKVYLDDAGIEQSYWALEQLLDDEEDDWQDAEEEKRQAEEAKRKAKLVQKPAHPNDTKRKVVEDFKAATSGTTVPDVKEEKPSSVLQTPPRRVLETDVKDGSQRPSRREQQEETVDPTAIAEHKPKPLLEKPPLRIVEAKEIGTKVDALGEGPTPPMVASSDAPALTLKTKPRVREPVDDSVLILQNPKLLYNLDEGHIEQ